jgi:hypothetical protein
VYQRLGAEVTLVEYAGNIVPTMVSEKGGGGQGWEGGPIGGAWGGGCLPGRCVNGPQIQCMDDA